MIALAESGMSTLSYSSEFRSQVENELSYNLSPMMFSRTGKFWGSMAR